MSIEVRTSGDPDHRDLSTALESFRFPKNDFYLCNQNQAVPPAKDGFVGGVVHNEKKISVFIGDYYSKKMFYYKNTIKKLCNPSRVYNQLILFHNSVSAILGSGVTEKSCKRVSSARNYAQRLSKRIPRSQLRTQYLISVMVIWNAFYTNILNGKLLILKRCSKRALYFEKIAACHK